MHYFNLFFPFLPFSLSPSRPPFNLTISMTLSLLMFLMFLMLSMDPQIFYRQGFAFLFGMPHQITQILIGSGDANALWQLQFSYL